MKTETVEVRAVKIAAKIMQADGLCRYDDVDECRRGYVTKETCERCICSWLLTKAKVELIREGKISWPAPAAGAANTCTMRTGMSRTSAGSVGRQSNGDKP